MFIDRVDAGVQLAERLADYADRDDVVVLALPRGGVPVAYEIARDLHAPLDVFLVRKLGVPWHKELAMGAIALGGVKVLNTEIIRQTGVSENEINRVIECETEELTKRNTMYRANQEPLSLEGKIIILVDDGIATGSTMKAAISALKQYDYQKLIVAVPVGPPDSISELRGMVDDVVCLETPRAFYAIGAWYENFSQTSNSEVVRLLEKINSHS